MPVQVLHGIRSNANSLRAILPPPIPPRRVHRLWRHNFRFILLFVGFFLCTFLSINANLFNFTMICLDPNGQNETNISEQQSNISMANFERQYPMWAMAFGTLFATIPFVHLYSLFGARRVLFIAALLSTISTALCPLAIFYGSFWALSSLRFIQGISYAADFGALGMLCAQWAALDEHGIFLSIISSYSPASTSIGNFLSGLFCSSSYFGWPSIYYLCSFCTLLIAFAWFALYSDQPIQSSQVTPKELEFIQKGKSTAHVGIDSAKKVPYLAILCSGLIWVCWLNAFADLVSAMFMLQYKPQYFKYVLGYSVFDTGWLTAIPSALHIPLKLSFGLASDRIKFISERHKLMLFNTIAVGLPGLSYLDLNELPSAVAQLGGCPFLAYRIAFASFPILSFLCFLSASIFLSAAGGGFYKCATLSSRQFGHFVMAGIQLNKCLSIFVGPALITVFVRNFGDQRQWQNIFIIFAILSLTANILFCLVATDQPAEFTNKRKMTMEEEERGNYARKSCPHFSIGEE